MTMEVVMTGEGEDTDEGRRGGVGGGRCWAWLIGKGRYDKAYESLARLRRHPIQAARDLYCQSKSIRPY